MIDNIDTLLRQLNIAKENNTSIVVLAENKDVTFEMTIIPNEIVYDDNGLEILDGNGFHFRIINPDRFELIKDDAWEDDYYVFRDSKGKEYYGIGF